MSPGRDVREAIDCLAKAREALCDLLVEIRNVESDAAIPLGIDALDQLRSAEMLLDYALPAVEALSEAADTRGNVRRVG